MRSLGFRSERVEVISDDKVKGTTKGGGCREQVSREARPGRISCMALRSQHTQNSEGWRRQVTAIRFHKWTCSCCCTGRGEEVGCAWWGVGVTGVGGVQVGQTREVMEKERKREKKQRMVTEKQKREKANEST